MSYQNIVRLSRLIAIVFFVAIYYLFTFDFPLQKINSKPNINFLGSIISLNDFENIEKFNRVSTLEKNETVSSEIFNKESLQNFREIFKPKSINQNSLENKIIIKQNFNFNNPKGIKAQNEQINQTFEYTPLKLEQ